MAKLMKDALKYDKELGKAEKASVLDKYYIPTRYPNGLPGGVPYEALTRWTQKGLWILPSVWSQP